MKPIHAFAVACLLPLTVLTAVGIAAAMTIPEDADRLERVAPQDQDADKPGEAESPLHQHMEALQDGMKAMRRMLGKPEQQAELVALAVSLQASAKAGIDLLPAQPEALTDPVAQAEWRVGYKRRMVAVLDTLLQIELAAAKGDGDACKELYKSLGEQKNTGHDAYQVD